MKSKNIFFHNLYFMIMILKYGNKLKKIRKKFYLDISIIR